MQNNPLGKYQCQQLDDLQGRELESAVLSRSATRLKECLENWTVEGNERQLMNALRSNQKIWTILQTDIEKNATGLPHDLQRNLLQLIAFIDSRTFDIMADPAKEKIQILIEININIAAGLSV